MLSSLSQAARISGSSSLTRTHMTGTSERSTTVATQPPRLTDPSSPIVQCGL
jgi:hypothetical protein